MKAATLVIILLSNHGYWLSNQPASISVQWNPTSNVRAADVSWDLMIGNISLASGKAVMPSDDKPATINLKCPSVRARTTVRWAYRITARDGGKELEHGEQAIELFPADLTQGWADLFKERQLAVLDSADRLPKLLDVAKVPYTRVDDPSRIDRADVVIVGEDQLDDSTFGQAALMSLAEQGKSILILHQSKPTTLAGYPIIARPAPTKLAWKLDHPLFDRLGEADVQSWLTPRTTLAAISLSADEPALELAYWPLETPATMPAKAPSPIEVVAFTKTIGNGRVVCFTIPLGPWQSDPRSQILLGNALVYLLTPPQPTLKPSERAVPTTKPTQPSGDSQ